MLIEFWQYKSLLSRTFFMLDGSTMNQPRSICFFAIKIQVLISQTRISCRNILKSFSKQYAQHKMPTQESPRSTSFQIFIRSPSNVCAGVKGWVRLQNFHNRIRLSSEFPAKTMPEFTTKKLYSISLGFDTECRNFQLLSPHTLTLPLLLALIKKFSL